MSGHEEDLKQTPFYEKHVQIGAKMVPFAGFLMPLQYTGIVAEHKNVRTNVGLFDVSHMGEIEVKGKNALDAVNKIITNDASKLKIGQALYTPMCYEHGGIVDDLLVYKRADDFYLLVVNASNLSKDFEWIHSNVSNIAQVENKSDEYAQLALQGRYAEAIIKKLSDYPVEDIEYYHFAEDVPVAGAKVLLSRTGYTGEDGFELYFDPADAHKVWDALLQAGAEYNLLPAGLGARDTLRLEARMVLYGNDITEHTNPIEAGIGWAVKFDKGDFIGRDVLLKVKEEKPKRKLVGIEMIDPGIPRQHYAVYMSADAQEPAGEVTSGTMSPTLKKAIGLAYLPFGQHKSGTHVWVDIRGRRKEAVVVKTPFYKRDY